MTGPNDPWQGGQQQPPQQPPWGPRTPYQPSPFGGQPQQPYGQPPYPYGGPPPMPRDSGKATASLVLGITGIFGLLMCCPLVMPILAVVLGSQARREIRESNGWVRGEGQAKAGVVLGWIGIALSVLLIAGLILAIALGGFDDPSYYEDDPIFSLLAPLPALLS